MSHSKFKIAVTLTPSGELLEMLERSEDMCLAVSYKHGEHYRRVTIENELIGRGLRPMNH